MEGPNTSKPADGNEGDPVPAVRRRGRPLRDPALAGLSPAERRACYQQAERARVLESFAALRDPDLVARSLGLDRTGLERLLGKLSIRRRVARLFGAHPTAIHKRAEKAQPQGGPVAPPAARPPAAVVFVRRRDASRPAPMPPFFPAPPVLAAPTAASPVPARRFVGGPAARRDVGELSAPEGAGRLWERVEAFRGNRRALERWMAEAYAHADGRPFTADDLDRALAANGLSERFRARQAENVRFLFGFHRGARGKVEQALFLTAEELDALVERLGLRAEVEAMRDFHRSAVLARMGVGDRLRLVLTREKYLADLGILDAVDRELEAYARERFERQAASAPAASAVEERVRREMGLDPEAMRRLMRRYRMVGFARSLLAASAAPARPMPAMR